MAGICWICKIKPIFKSFVCEDCYKIANNTPETVQKPAEVVKQADTGDLKSPVPQDVQVQVLPSAPITDEEKLKLIEKHKTKITQRPTTLPNNCALAYIHYSNAPYGPKDWPEIVTANAINNCIMLGNKVSSMFTVSDTYVSKEQHEYLLRLGWELIHTRKGSYHPYYELRYYHYERPEFKARTKKEDKKTNT